MAIQFGATAATSTRSAATIFNATNTTVGMRLYIPSHAGIVDFRGLCTVGGITGGTGGGIFLGKHPTAQNYYVETFSAAAGLNVESTIVIADATWFSLVIRCTGTGAGSYQRFLFNHSSATYTTSAALSSTRSFGTGQICVGARIEDSVGGLGGVIVRYEDVWISHDSVPDAVCEGFVRGVSARFLLRHLLGYWPMETWVSGNIADLVGAAPLSSFGTPSVQDGPGWISRPEARWAPKAIVAGPIYTQTKFQIYNDDGTGLGPPP